MTTRRLGYRGMLFACAALAVATLTVVQAENPNDRARLLKTRECAGCDLSGANLSPADLSGISAPSAIFTDAILYRSKLNGADLSGANLSGANLRGANLTKAKLTGANLDGADLSQTVGATLSDAITTATTKCPAGAQGPCS